MADYWKSMPRKFCEFCKCWLTDNKPSIEFHERGKRHQENVQKKLKELRKKGQKDFDAKKKMDYDLRKMNEAALKAYEKDVERDPMLARELTTVEAQKAQLVPEPVKPVTPEPVPPKVKEPKVKGQKSKKHSEVQSSTSMHSSIGPSNLQTPYGKWVAVDNSVAEPIDLQLPQQEKETIVYKVVTVENPENKFKFKEKTVTTLNESGIFGDAEVMFKKRKLNAALKRNVRRRDGDDADD